MEARAKSYVGVGADTGAGALLHCVAVIGAGAGMLVSMVSSGKALARAATKGRRAKRINSLASLGGEVVACGLEGGVRAGPGTVAGRASWAHVHGIHCSGIEGLGEDDGGRERCSLGAGDTMPKRGRQPRRGAYSPPLITGYSRAPARSSP